MRLFVALDPPPGALEEMEAVIAPLRAGWPELRWTGQDRWHVTLAFLGEVAEGKLDDLAARLGRAAARHQPQELRIGHGGAFPNLRRARVVVAHIDGEQPALEALAALAASVAAGARRAGAPPPDEGRRYRPHLTLARCRQPTDVGGVVDAIGGFSGRVWVGAEMKLIMSHAGPKPWYETLVSWPIGRRGAGPG